MKLTDTQLVLLSAASQRPDRALVLSDNLKGGAAARTTRKLLDGNLVEEVAANGGLPVWRHGSEGQPLALIVTDAGLKEIGVEPESMRVETEPPHATSAKPRDRGRRSTGIGTSVDPAPSATGASKHPARPPAGKNEATALAGVPLVRSGTKTAQLIGLLEQPEGASIDKIVAALAWLPHTTRAAITGLRKRGYEIDRQKSADAPTTYRITAGPTAPNAVGGAAGKGGSAPSNAE